MTYMSSYQNCAISHNKLIKGDILNSLCPYCFADPIVSAITESEFLLIKLILNYIISD